MRWLDAPRRQKRGRDDVPDVADADGGRLRGGEPRRLSRRALEIWAPLAHAGVARAQNNIGACFAEGLGVERDPALAVQWLTLAAAAGDPVGQRNLRGALFQGRGRRAGLCARAELYRAAAEQGDAPRRTC